MDHDHGANRAGRVAPRGLPDLLRFVLFVEVGHIEHLGEVLTKHVAGSTLDATTRAGNVKFDGSGAIGTGKGLILGFATLDDGNGEQFLVAFSVDFQNLKCELLHVLFSSVSSVTFLPQEFSSADEWCGVLELPPHNVGPLVDHHWQVSVRVNPLGKGRVHDRLRRGSDGNWLSQFTLA